MNTENNNEYLFNLINILSFIIEIEKLESHLSKQDKQYEEIIQLLKEGGILDGRREQN